MYYLDKKQCPTDPPTAAGLFVGWKIHTGMRYRGKVFVADFEKIRTWGFRAESLVELPAEECHFPEQIQFPFANARKLAAESMRPEIP